MADISNFMSNSDGFKYVIDFDAYFDAMRNSLTGRKYKLVKAGVIKLPDGTIQDQYINKVQEPDLENQAVNDAGADYIIGELRQFMNPHAAMGDLVNDGRCRRLAADITNNIVAEIESTPGKYGCSEEKFGMLNFRMATTTRSLYTFFTALREGKILTFGRETTGSQTTRNVDDKPDSSSGGLTIGRH